MILLYCSGLVSPLPICPFASDPHISMWCFLVSLVVFVGHRPSVLFRHVFYIIGVVRMLLVLLGVYVFSHDPLFWT